MFTKIIFMMNQRQHRYYNQLKETVESKGGELLSDTYVNSTTKVNVKCCKGHQWNVVPGSIKQGSWCPQCGGTARLTIEDMQIMAVERNGKCLSTKYTNKSTSLLWECEFGHQWKATPGSVRNQNTWCKKCMGLCKLTIEDMKNMATERGGKCLSSEYVNASTHLLWQCREGHTWEATTHSVKNKATWCKQCAGLCKLTLGDMQKIAEERGGRCISTKYINNSTPLLWECEFGHRWNALPNNIKIRGSWCPECVGLSKLTIDEMHKLAESKGGKCLSTEYINNGTQLFWQCEFEHQWWAIPSTIKHEDTWCPHCSGNFKLTIEEMCELAESKNGKCLSTEYTNIDTPLIWECEFGHKWKTAPNSIKNNGSWCPLCLGSIKLTIEGMCKLAESRGGKCLSTEYINNNTRLLWQCEIGHQWYALPSNIKNKNSWCPRCKSSKGETECSNVLTKLSIEFIPEYSDYRSTNRRYDFRFVVGENHYLLEFDGIQHFEHIDFFHRTEDEFIERQQVDIDKTQFAVSHGYKLIRIDYNEICNIESHITGAIRKNESLYLSNHELYHWIHDSKRVSNIKCNTEIPTPNLIIINTDNSQ